MFSVIRQNKNQSRMDDTYDYACLSTDNKKTEGIKNGSLLLEMDTGKFYAFDADSGDWVEVAGSGGGGGGGSSDFSTAQVTFICNAENEVRCELAMAEEASPPFVPNPQTLSSLSLYNGDESTVTAVLYKGTNSCLFSGATQVSGTGDVRVFNSSAAAITGDCTITIS